MSVNNRPIRVRFAPSPTGPLHIGGVRTALYNFLLARQLGGTMILRIEDTDQTRFVPGAEDYIIEALTWLGITFDEGTHVGGPHAPYRQSERKAMYRQYADQLINDGHAYYAFDTPEELEAMRERFKATNTASYNYVTREAMKNSLTLPADEVKRKLDAGEPYVIRIKVPRKEEIRVTDLIRGNVLTHTSQMDDKVLFKSDGMPTYHLANVVDDYLMKITHVIRGEEWLPSAPLHVLLYRCFGWEDVMPQFAHLPLLLKPEGNGKLSKRDGDKLGFPVFPLLWKDPITGELSSGYRESGYIPEAVVNMLAFLGWNPGNNQELYTMEELIKDFSIERVSKSGAKFDLQKAKWFNQQFLRNSDDTVLAEQFIPILQAKGIDTSKYDMPKICGMIKEKATFIGDFWELGFYFFMEPTDFDAELIKKKWNANLPALFSNFATALNLLASFSPAEVETTYKAEAEKLGINAGQTMQLLRHAITGTSGGPVLFDMLALLGKETVVSRLTENTKKFEEIVK